VDTMAVWTDTTNLLCMFLWTYIFYTYLIQILIYTV
jgi:hypothetical protein